MSQALGVELELREQMLQDLRGERDIQLAQGSVAQALRTVLQEEFDGAWQEATRDKRRPHIGSTYVLQQAAFRDMLSRASDSPLRWWEKMRTDPTVIRDMRGYVRAQLSGSIQNVLGGNRKFTATREQTLRPLIRALDRLARKEIMRRPERTFPRAWEREVATKDITAICDLYYDGEMTAADATLLALNKRVFLREQQASGHQFLHPASVHEEPVMREALSATERIMGYKSDSTRIRGLRSNETMFGTMIEDPTTRQLIAVALMTLGPAPGTKAFAKREQQMQGILSSGISGGRLQYTPSHEIQTFLEQKFLSGRSADIFLLMSRLRGGVRQLFRQLWDQVQLMAEADEIAVHTYCRSDLEVFFQGEKVVPNTPRPAANVDSWKLLIALGLIPYANETNVPTGAGRAFSVAAGANKEYDVGVVPSWQHFYGTESSLRP